MHAWTSRAQRYLRPYNLKARFTDQETEAQLETAGLSRATALLTPGLLLILLVCGADCTKGCGMAAPIKETFQRPSLCFPAGECLKYLVSSLISEN